MSSSNSSASSGSVPSLPTLSRSSNPNAYRLTVDSSSFDFESSPSYRSVSLAPAPVSVNISQSTSSSADYYNQYSGVGHQYSDLDLKSFVEVSKSGSSGSSFSSSESIHKSQPQQKSQTAIQVPQAESLFSQLKPGPLSESSAPVAPCYIEPHYHAYSSESASYLLRSCEHSLLSQGISCEVDESKYRIRCLSPKHDRLSFVVRVWKKSVSSTENILEMQRRNGCCRMFNSIWNDLMKQLGDIQLTLPQRQFESLPVPQLPVEFLCPTICDELQHSINHLLQMCGSDFADVQIEGLQAMANLTSINSQIRDLVRSTEGAIETLIGVLDQTNNHNLQQLSSTLAAAHALQILANLTQETEEVCVRIQSLPQFDTLKHLQQSNDKHLQTLSNTLINNIAITVG